MVRGILMAVMMTVVSTLAVFAQQQLTEEQKEVVSAKITAAVEAAESWLAVLSTAESTVKAGRSPRSFF